MPRSHQTIHTESRGASQGLPVMAVDYQATVFRLVRRLIAVQCPPDTVHAIRTHCRRLQALLELCGDDERAVPMAQSVGRLSKPAGGSGFLSVSAKDRDATGGCGRPRCLDYTKRAKAA